MPAIVLIRGAGDLASGIALRLHRAGLDVVMTELVNPVAVRRTVAFAEAIYEGQVTVEDVRASRAPDPTDIPAIIRILASGHIPVLADPDCAVAAGLRPLVIIDARMLKEPPEVFAHAALMYLGLGPGFRAPDNCHALIETDRGHSMGRVIWHGAARTDTSQPEGDGRRVFRAPADGILRSEAAIGQHFEAGQLIASVGVVPVTASFTGTLRGLLRTGLHARKGMKIGDLDSRDDPDLCRLVSDKSLAVGGGVLEAMLTRAEVRSQLWI
jgi:xanthine dehydrogenase accessory factor